MWGPSALDKASVTPDPRGGSVHLVRPAPGGVVDEKATEAEGKHTEVGPARFGLATSRLSAGRSNQAKLRARAAAEDRA